VDHLSTQLGGPEHSTPPASRIRWLGGGLNGLIVAKARIAPILTTLASLSIFSGLALWVLPVPGRVRRGGPRRRLGRSTAACRSGTVTMAGRPAIVTTVVRRLLVGAAPTRVQGERGQIGGDVEEHVRPGLRSQHVVGPVGILAHARDGHR